MGFFASRRDRILEGGIEGTAVIRESERFGNESANSGEPWPWEITLNVIGSRRYRLRLEVRLPGREPYEVEGPFKVPRRAENVSMFNIGRVLPQGLELPVRVDPGDEVAVQVDWDRFLASAGRKEAMREGTEAAQRRRMRTELERNPKLAAKARAGNRGAVRAWAQAVHRGQMSREEFERTVTQEVETGRMDPADAEAARRDLGTADGT